MVLLAPALLIAVPVALQDGDPATTVTAAPVSAPVQDPFPPMAADRWKWRAALYLWAANFGGDVIEEEGN